MRPPYRVIRESNNKTDVEKLEGFSRVKLVSRDWTTQGHETTSFTSDSFDSHDGPSWGLIIPIIMIGVFLLCVAGCLYWHKWRDRRRRALNRRNRNPPTFARGYHGAASRGVETIRNSTRSTTPLHRNSRGTVHVIPIQKGMTGKYALEWDYNENLMHKKKPIPVVQTHLPRVITPKPLSPINEMDSPLSKMSNISKNYHIDAQPPFSPYHLVWLTKQGSIRQSSEVSFSSNTTRTRAARRCSESRCRISTASSDPLTDKPFTGYNSPFHPQHNTPNTDCEADSETESGLYKNIETCLDHVLRSQVTSCKANSVISHVSSGIFRSQGESALMTTYQTSSEGMGGSYVAPPPTQIQSSMTEHSGPYSIPSTIHKYESSDLNNNSLIVTDSYMGHSGNKAISYTLASSIASSETQSSGNTSMLPNVGSSNTSGQPTHGQSLKSEYVNTVISSNVSTEDLSKIVNDMSSIRPNSSTDPSSRMVISSEVGNSASAEFYHSWNNFAENDGISHSSKTTGSLSLSKQDGSFIWDNYSLKSHPGSPSSQSFPDFSRIQEFDGKVIIHIHQPAYKVPVLMEKQYWV
ncbi:hypothetical protein CHS0354_004109 [Potamilus streckersoni]|uniref:Uncharacterized protein n=1 Tax=Potamilus streckersoni TaxID=2493646 RepID=A0AAE0SJ52_9BIVA|nr:hypothetical protein CHS0354_004109 [Potamilus streckersoni]